MAADLDGDPSPDAREFRLLLPFPDQSLSFELGFEAGMIWQQIVGGAKEVDPICGMHAENAEVFRRMGAAQGYDVEIIDAGDRWIMLTMTKRARRFTVV